MWTLVSANLPIFLLFFLISFPSIPPSLSTVDVSSERPLLCSSLSSVGITQLLQYYEAIRLPVVLLAFSRFAVVCHTCNDKKQQALPSWLNSHNVKHKVLFDPAEANHFSPMRIDLYCFPSKLKRQPSRYQNFEAQSHSLFSRCLRLATTITGSHPRLATGGWLDLTRQAFHLLDYSPLSGRTISICITVLSLFYQISPTVSIASLLKTLHSQTI